jgi:hypothetical protein
VMNSVNGPAVTTALNALSPATPQLRTARRNARANSLNGHDHKCDRVKRIESPHVPDATSANGGLWTQADCAAFLAVSPRWLRDSTAPKVMLPGGGPAGRPIVRYEPAAIQSWYKTFTAGVRAGDYAP